MQAVKHIAEILSIVKEDDLMEQFREFEAQLEINLRDLRRELSKQILSQDVPFLQAHMAMVESWRDRVGRYHSLVAAFVEHSKSSHFILPGGKGTTEFDRKSYEKKLAAGWTGLEVDLAHLVRSIDSRVNACKLQLRLEEETSAPRNKFQAQGR